MPSTGRKTRSFLIDSSPSVQIGDQPRISASFVWSESTKLSSNRIMLTFDSRRDGMQGQSLQQVNCVLFNTE